MVDSVPSLDEFAALLRHRLSFSIEENITPYDLLAEAGIDSLRVLEMVLCVESLAGVMIPPAEPPLIGRIVDAYDYFLACKENPGL